eukprot:gnl/TRDRNA2_/TRDRNA2_56242_c0_seq2.p1 gnl/TRDRNA2_/TRDRNA2_56242_c0~~gnl/TRDRNA2_/TRDRNA2_56242_c0_seq2.p1  ORF type:complete len:328 (-),score=52.48 gnl/TRDRNA2_/TRDRNA2_56242_c0_seq2:69-1052(-)
MFVRDKDDPRYDKPGPVCEDKSLMPGEQPKIPDDAGGGALGAVAEAKDKAGAAASAVGKVASNIASLAMDTGKATDGHDCNARMVDYPYGMVNPEGTRVGASKLREANQALPLTVWGMAVHGKSGTWAFDNHGPHAAEFIYEARQGKGAPSDYYLCDSRDGRPQQCALIGGNLRHACAEWYDPHMCDECEDHGSTIVCAVRGWNNRRQRWVKVPIYPRDLLGELYRGEWRDVFSRPMWASVEIPKAALRKGVKQMPDALLGAGPVKEVFAKKGEPTETPLALNPLASSIAPSLTWLVPAAAVSMAAQGLMGQPPQVRKRFRTARDFL